MYDLTRVPVEIWWDITIRACTDGGFTGRSLALTSTFFHTQSLSTRFHSVSLTSLARVEGLLEFLHHQPEGYQPTTEHLYLSFDKEPAPLIHPRDFWRINSTWSKERYLEYYQRVALEKALWQDRFVAAMTALFALVAPSLRTLTIIDHIVLPFSPFPYTTLPKLEELSVCGPLNLFLPLSGSGSFRLPALKRLHCVQRHQPVETTLDILIKHAPPSFSHLRFSSVASNSPGHLSGHLAAALGTQCRFVRTTPPPCDPCLSGIRHLIIHGFPPAPGGTCGTPFIVWGQVCGGLRLLAKQLKDEKSVDMLMMSRKWRKNPRWADRLRDDWIDRIEGGKGCWVTSSQEEAELEKYEDDPLSELEEPVSFLDIDVDDDF